MLLASTCRRGSAGTVAQEWPRVGARVGASVGAPVVGAPAGASVGAPVGAPAGAPVGATFGAPLLPPLVRGLSDCFFCDPLLGNPRLGCWVVVRGSAGICFATLKSPETLELQL